MTNDAPVFIGGLMKSGTSLVRKLLSRHPRLFSGFETHWFSDDVQLRWRDIESRRQRWNRQFYNIPEGEFKMMVMTAQSGAEFLDRMMAFCAKREGKQRWIEKTPDNLLHLSLIRSNWPNAKFLHVVRDLRDVWAAQKRKGVLFPDFCQSVIRHVDVLADLPGTTTPFYREVPYEELVTDTEASLKAVLEFIGEEWSPNLAEYHGDPSEFERILEVTGNESSTARSLASPIFDSKVGEWKRQITDEESSAIMREFHEPMRKWGYL